MPELTEPKIPQTVDLNAQPFKFENMPLAPDYAVTMVDQTFQRYSTERIKNYDQKWIEADALYEGIVQQKLWENSKIPRANIPDNIAFDHVEGATAMIEAAIFDSSDEWFGVDAMDDSDPRDARDIHKVFSRDLDLPDEFYGFATARRELRLAFKSTLQYGEGMLLLEWDERNRRPRLRNIDIRDVFIDPDVKSPNIEEARSIIIRDLISVDELKKMEGLPGVYVPDDGVLEWARRNNHPTMADDSKRTTDMLRGLQINPGYADQLPLPSANRVEILRYYDRGRIIWILERTIVMFRSTNPYRFYPLVAAPCRPQLNRFYGTGYPWAIRFQQKLIEGLERGMLDEITLNLNPPQVVPRDARPSEYNVYPGRTASTADPKSVVVQAPQGIAMNLQPLVSEYRAISNLRNGLSAMAQGGGVTTPGQVRTALGVQAQEQGSNSRLAHVIKNIEDYMLVPMFYKLRRMYQVHVMPDEPVIPAYPMRDGQQAQPVLGFIFHRPVLFRMEAAARLLNRAAAGQALPFWMQFASSGQMMEGLATTGRTIDFVELEKLAQYATGVAKRFQIVRPLNEQEQQARNTPPPQAQMQMQAQQAAQQQDAQLKLQIAGMQQQSAMAKVQGDITRAQIAKQPDPMEAQIKQQEAQAKIAAEREKNQLKLQTEAALAELKIRAQQQKNEVDAQKARASLIQSQQAAQQKMQQGAMDMQMKRVQAQQQMEVSRAQAIEKATQPRAPKSASSPNDTQ